MGDISALLDRLETADQQEVSGLVADLRAHPALNDADAPDAGRAAHLLLQHGGMGDLQTAAELAWMAHNGGVAGAGADFATCIDRIGYLTARAQRFGTLTIEHQGDLHLAPLDGTISDDVRAQLGLGTLASMRAEVEERNRERARARAAAPGLPAGQPYARVWRDPSAAELRARWAKEGEPCWADGDELTFVCDRPLAGALVGPLFEIPMWRVGDLLTLTVRVQRLEEVVLTYGFWPLDEQGAPAFSRRPDPDGRFRGARARPPAPTNDQILGTLTETAVESTSLGEARRVTVYRPPGHTPAERLPVVYATDGQFFAPYARRLDAAIEQGTVPRCVVVASHAGPGAARTGEYFPGYEPASFDRHQRFFVDDLARWAEAELGVSTDRNERAVFGCSDGGAHALAVGLAHHGRFGQVIAYSSGMPPNGDERWPAGQAPYVQLCAGILEGQFHMATAAWAYFLGATKVDHHWTERVCGHELIQWVEELPAAVGRAFGP